MRGYNLKDLKRTKETIRGMDREHLFKEKVNKRRDYSMPFMTGYTRQYKQFEKIMREHWPLKLKDRELKSIPPDKPQFIYTKPCTLWLKLAHNSINPPRKVFTILDHTGFFSCGKCVICKTSMFRRRKTTHFESYSQERSFEFKKCFTCGTTHYVSPVLSLWSPIRG